MTIRKMRMPLSLSPIIDMIFVLGGCSGPRCVDVLRDGNVCLLQKIKQYICWMKTFKRVGQVTDHTIFFGYLDRSVMFYRCCSISRDYEQQFRERERAAYSSADRRSGSLSLRRRSVPWVLNDFRPIEEEEACCFWPVSNTTRIIFRRISLETSFIFEMGKFSSGIYAQRVEYFRNASRVSACLCKARLCDLDSSLRRAI